jgi:hypothetical protein
VTTYQMQMGASAGYHCGEHIQEGFSRPNGYGLGQYLECAFGGVLQNDKYTAVAANIINSLIIVRGARNLSQPKRPMIVDYDRKVFIHG